MGKYHFIRYRYPLLTAADQHVHCLLQRTNMSIVYGSGPRYPLHEIALVVIVNVYYGLMFGIISPRLIGSNNIAGS